MTPTPSELVEHLRDKSKTYEHQIPGTAELMANSADCIERLSAKLIRAKDAQENLAANCRNYEERAERAECQLAGCGVAALGYGEACQHGEYGWSASFQDVMNLRQRAEAVEKRAAKYKEALHELAAGMAAIGRLDLLDTIESALAEDGT